MADWNLPLLVSLYKDFMDLLKARDEDSITLGKNAIINPVIGTIRYDRPGNYFQEWNGTAWIPLIISMTSGGLGANTPAGGRAALGLGTIATQDANNVSITGGTIQNLSSLGVNGVANVGSLGVTGSASIGGSAVIAGNTATGSLNSGPAIVGPLNVNGDAGISGNINAVHAGFSGLLYLGNTPHQVSTPEGLLQATKLAGIVPTPNLGNGTANDKTFLRGDSTWVELNMQAYRNNQFIRNQLNLVVGTMIYDIPITGFTNPSKMMFVPSSSLEGANVGRTEVFTGHVWFPAANILRYQLTIFIGGDKPHTLAGMVLELI